MNKIKRFKVLRLAMERRVTDDEKGFISNCFDRIGRDDIEQFLLLLNVTPFEESELIEAEKIVDAVESHNRCQKCKRTHYHCRCR